MIEKMKMLHIVASASGKEEMLSETWGSCISRKNKVRPAN